MDEKKLPLYIDLVFCLILLPLMITLLPVEKWFVRHPLFVVLFVFWLYSVYFLNRRITAPLILDRKKYFYAIGLLIFTIIITYFISQYKLGGPPHFRGPIPPHGSTPFCHPHPMPPMKLRMHQQGIWLLFVVVTVFSHSVGLLARLNLRNIEKKELEQAKQKAELALYKAQINPHFLFNTLNTLYGLLITGSDKTEAAFMQFTDMMKYMYSNPSRDTIPLAEEANYINRYIELQKLRLNEHTKVTFNYLNKNDVTAEIVPMLLITFVENAFKFGVSSHTDSYIDICLGCMNGRIFFEVSNTIVADLSQKKGDGIGIDNCRKRLDLIYGSSYRLETISDSSKYRVLLDVPSVCPVNGKNNTIDDNESNCNR